MKVGYVLNVKVCINGSKFYDCYYLSSFYFKNLIYVLY